MLTSLSDFQSALANTLQIQDNSVTIVNKEKLQTTLIDELIFSALFSPDQEVQKQARIVIKQTANILGAVPSSIKPLYTVIGEGKAEKNFTAAAMNVRTLTYDMARLVFRLAKEKRIGPFIFEISRTEMEYTHQRPDAYMCAVLAAAIKENYQGPIFLQGDHFQFSLKKYTENPEQERKNLMSLIDEALLGGFYNIDIDASTLVDLKKENLDDQQKENYQNTAVLTKYIREHQPKNIAISIGAEIGHIGDRNSTVDDFNAFMAGFLPLTEGLDGISKISVATGTSHGGVPLPDGSIAKVNLDFQVLEDITTICRQKYHVAGSVQHGASTLPNELFHLFPEHKTLEIHLATGFQNIVYDNLSFALKQTMYHWINTSLQKEKEPDWTEEQFIYKMRKKALGQFEQTLWELSNQEKKPILDNLEKELRFLFEKLGLFETRDLVDKYFY